MKSAVVREVVSLENKTLLELKAIWKRLFESDAPPYSRQYLIKRIAYRLQEMAYGGLSIKTAKKLDYLADQMEQGKKISNRSNLPISGTRLIREYHGIKHEVTVIDTGFAYQGQYYKSLSKIAGLVIWPIILRVS